MTHPLRRVHVWTYPWDLARLGPGEAAPMLADLGVEAVSLTTAYHAGRILSLAEEDPEWVDPPAGRPLWRVPPEELPGTLRGRDFRSFVAEAAEALARHGLGLRAWTIAFHDVPDLPPVEDAFGHTLPHAPCPLAGRAYLEQLAEDLRQLGPFETLELESSGFTPPWHGAHHEIAGVLPTPLLQLLLGLCFCPTCRARFQKANLDADALRQRVRRVLRRELSRESGPTEPLVDLTSALVEEPDLARAVAIRAEAVAEGVEAAARRFGGTVAVIAQPFARPARLAFLEGIALTPPPQAASLEFIPLAYGSPPSVAEDVRAALDRGWDPRRLVVGLTLVQGVAADWGRAEASLEAAMAQGARRFSFYNLGILPGARRSWLGRLSERIRRAPAP